MILIKNQSPKIFIKAVLAAFIIIIASGSAFSQFGQNKVQYKVFDWKFIQSKHFDIYFSQGPMDVLDHSCSKLGFGGKMCIDGTLKLEEEMTEPLPAFKLSAEFSAAGIKSKLSEITSLNENLARNRD